ncbi:CHASE2 domain-containing protein [Phormidium sp. LEGE 05292]|uniref:CHASE2 domain-containing protein n=1 Tax=[Phormidium] sp. LEGE 05292 TaxID=767427 RepID=UPI00187DF9D2|nr:CHASE2 domain-containing protein [Phormidium sp. LEGE 05292]MBE9225126.1 CHASE2 domain-containing protein [Phormidium sp. LEGE 05292]
MISKAVYKLKIERIDRTCRFELSWGNGQQLFATLEYPESLTKLYQEWQRIYLSFYNSALRGRVQSSGSGVMPKVDWHNKLIEAETEFLQAFNHWLRSAELFEIRQKIMMSNSANIATVTTTILLTCYQLELERLPWEAWEICTNLAQKSQVNIIRTPPQIREENFSEIRQKLRQKSRILVIVGDDTGLHFQTELAALKSLSRFTEIKFVGWQPEQEEYIIRQNVCQAIADPQGWDLLCFLGHSNEAEITGGKIAIAPNVHLTISEISPYLTQAKQRGLQFAIFNSCCGLNIAASLINLGLSQVIIMREQIHNQVAEEFFLRFLLSLNNFKNVYEAMFFANEYLQQEKLKYPSAYLIPSIFGHPNAELFQLQPNSISQKLKQLLPTRNEAIVLSILTAASLYIPLQDYLLDLRILTQAVYREITNQIPVQTTPPPTLLVQIDEKSIRLEKDISNPKPMPRHYLAKLVDKLSELDAKVIGIDYLLHRPSEIESRDKRLAQSLINAVQKPKPSWIISVTNEGINGERLKPLPEIVSPNWSLQGEMNLIGGFMQLATPEINDPHALPFSYLLAIAYQLNFKNKNNVPQPQLQSQQEFLIQIQESLKLKNNSLFSARSYLQPLTEFSYIFGQMWLHPVIDYSIPPEQVYDRIPAWQLLNNQISTSQKSHLQKQVVIIAPGGYKEAGVAVSGLDFFSKPAAICYWRIDNDCLNQRREFTGAEIHAYMVHHHLNNSMIIPIPDLWMIGIAGLLGKFTLITLNNRHRQQEKHKKSLGKNTLTSEKKQWIILVISALSGYGIISLQTYVTSGILLPWLLPSVTFFTYAIPIFVRKN